MQCYCRTSSHCVLTTVVHPIQPQQVQITEVIVLAKQLGLLRVLGCDGGVFRVLIEGVGVIVHDGLIVIRCVLVCYECVIILVKVMLHTCIH